MDLPGTIQSNLNQLQKSMEEEWGILSHRLESAEEQLSVVSRRCLELSEHRDKLAHQASGAEQEISRLQAEINRHFEVEFDRQKLIKRIAALEAQSQEDQATIAGLRDQIHQEAQQVSELTLALVDTKLDFEKARRLQDGYVVEEQPKLNLPELVPGQDEAAPESEGRRLQRLAYEDPVTGLPNFHLGTRYLAQELTRAADGQATVGLMILDIEKLNELNLYLGHAVADQVLAQFPLRLKSCLQADDALVRGRDDEFWVILPRPERGPLGLKSMGETVNRVLQRMAEALKTPFEIEDHTVLVRFSAGLAFGQGKESAEQLVERASLALSSCKRENRRVSQYQPEMERGIRQRMELIPLLRQAFNRNQFVLHFQPMVELKTRQIKGVETLLRWEHPLKGIVEPGDFLEAANQCGVMVGIGDWVAREVCQLSAGQRQYVWSMNFSAQELIQADFVRRFTKAIEAAQLSRPEFLMVEVSETELVGDSERLGAVLKELRHWNIQLAIDDFSFGSLSLRRLQQWKANYLKLGAEIVHNVDQPFYRNLVRGAVLAAESLGCKVIAEGIEQPAQLDALLEQGCHWGQGHLLSPALPLEQLMEKLQVKKP